MQAADTRDRILTHMFLDIRKNGFQGLRADKVIAEMDITKGALYHYFANKQAIGKAVIDEIIRPNYLRFYQELDRWEGNPVDKLQEHLRFLTSMASDEEVSLGCPLNNLVQEMSPLDEDFRLRMKSIIDQIHKSVSAALTRGIDNGYIRRDIQPEHVAQFYFAGIEGAYVIAKVRKDGAAFKANMAILADYLNSLKV
jgi:AcrR family transcriptional regulator